MRRLDTFAFTLAGIFVFGLGMSEYEKRDIRERERDKKIDYLIDLHDQGHEERWLLNRIAAKLDLHTDLALEQQAIDLRIQRVEWELESVRESLDDLNTTLTDRLDMAEYERGWDEAMEACDEDGDAYREPPC